MPRRGTRSRHSPCSVDEAEVDEPVHDEHPHHREVPVARAGEPAAERQTRRDLLVLERIAAERLAPAREGGVRVEDPQPAPDHDRERDDVDPMRDADDRVMTLLHAFPNTKAYTRKARTIEVDRRPSLGSQILTFQGAESSTVPHLMRSTPLGSAAALRIRGIRNEVDGQRVLAVGERARGDAHAADVLRRVAVRAPHRRLRIDDQIPRRARVDEEQRVVAAWDVQRSDRDVEIGVERGRRRSRRIATRCRSGSARRRSFGRARAAVRT